MTAAPSLSYASGNTPRPTGRRFVVSLRVTAGVMVLLAILVGWNIFSYFGVTHRFYMGPAWTSPRIIPVLEFKWHALWNATPVFLILLGFAAAYFLMARRVKLGSEPARFAASVTSMILTLVSALWVLTLFVYGAINVSDAKLWWESVLSVMMIGMSVTVVPWLAYVTILGFDQLRRPRVRHENAAEETAPPEESPAENAAG